MLMSWKKYFIGPPYTFFLSFYGITIILKLIASLSTCSVSPQKTLTLSPNYFTLMEQTKAGTI